MDLSERDRSVNANEQRVRRHVLEHLTIDPKREQILSLILISAVQEAERLGDLAKSLAQASTLAGKPRLSPHVEPLRALRIVGARDFHQLLVLMLVAKQAQRILDPVACDG